MARISLTHYLIRCEREHGLDANLRLLIETVARACKTISHAVGKGALGGVLGSAGSTNVQGETQKKLDILANEILVEARKKFPEKPGRRDSARFWMLLTDLKHMESKRDRDYYGWERPMNYAKWVTDGAETYGTVPKVTLDDFAQ